MGELPWVRIYCRGENRGGGILLTSQLVVTAAHCVPGVRAGHPQEELCASVGHSSSTVPAQLVERIDAQDLALLRLSQPIGTSVRLPWASRCRRGDGWFAPSRPTMADPELDGSVTGTMNYEAVSGGVVHAVQLTTQAHLGNYAGYSGGPVFLSPEESNLIIGILIEQYPDRIDLDRASNTLFAAAIEGVLEQFHTLSTAYLLRSLFDHPATSRPQRPEPLPAAESGNWVAAERSAKVVLGWLAVDVVDPEIRTVHQALVSKWVTRQAEEVGEVG
jgi:Trypsin-like peptidase domain